MDTTSQPWQMILDGVRSMPASQTALVVLFFAFVILAGNGVFALHYRRVGKPIFRSLINPASFPISDFNLREWLLLAAVFAVSMLLAVLAAHAA